MEFTFTKSNTFYILWQSHADDWPCHTGGRIEWFFPMSYVCVCVRVCVYVCVYQSLACPRDNSWPVQARITKFGPEKQNTLAKIPIGFFFLVFFTFEVKFNFKLKIDPIVRLSKPLLTTYYR